MFDRFVRFAQAEKALRQAQFAAAVEFLDDPAIRQHRRAGALRRKALAGVLQRGQRRLDAGEVAPARSDCEFVLRHDPDSAAAGELRRAIASVEDQGATDRQTAGDLCRRARVAVEHGALAVARDLLDRVTVESGEATTLRRLIEARREAAASGIQRARLALAAGNVESARAEIGSARALDDALDGVAELSRRLDEALATQLWSRVEAAKDAAEALEIVAVARQTSPDVLLADPRLRDAVHARALVASGAIRTALEAADLVHGNECYRQFSRGQRELLRDAIGTGLETLESVQKQVERGDPSAPRALRGLAEQCGVQALGRLASRVEAQHRRDAGRLRRARELAAAGDVRAAREAVREVLALTPTHAVALKEMQRIEDGERDRRERLAAARAAAERGELAAAMQLARALQAPGPVGDEARSLLDELEARVDAVQRGLNQVKRDACGRSSGTQRGLEHCIARAEELMQLQSDETELAGLVRALRAEVSAMQALSRLRDAFDRRAVEAMAQELANIAGAREAFLAPDRLDARAEEQIDQILRSLHTDVDAGRLTAVERVLEVLQHASLPAAWVSGWDDLEKLRRQRAERAERDVERGLVAIERRDLEAAETALDAARVAWIDGPVVTRLERALGGLRDCEVSLDGVEALVGRDTGAAQAHLDELGPTPGMFRTRIYDLRKDLARAQGLDHGFLLRVDEGGEWLVLRGESLTIGNVRDGGADVPILAAVAGRHARIRRTLSFHGGLEDKIEPEHGDVFVDGRPIDGPVRLRDGVEIRLGRSLHLGYRQPCRRSLTAALTLRGHAVGGTDKLLLMKDRGRDGRILIGPGRDVHVQVPNAVAEVEIFASKDGQVRVRTGGRGTIDGMPFTGEEPVIAGAIICAGGVTFVAQPWSKAE